jgi:glutathione S-transferase
LRHDFPVQTDPRNPTDPNSYASQEAINAAETAEQKKALYLFNCAQRAHYNFLENYVAALPATLIAGLVYPKAAAATGAAWCFFRILYATGYTRADKDKGTGRYAGAGFWFAQLGLFLMVGKIGLDLVWV